MGEDRHIITDLGVGDTPLLSKPMATRVAHETPDYGAKIFLWMM